jgi:deazaflavin-dependent oxidoreductase (nitroreductase family)
MIGTSTLASDAPSRPAVDLAPVGTMTEPPRLGGVTKALSDASRLAFRYANRYAMVPLHRAGLAAWLGNPLTGWQCLVTTVGRRSGLRRHTPLGYIVMDGAAWVLAGFGPRTLWYRNILEDPRVELLLPGRSSVAAIAEEERDASIRARIIPSLCRSMALPGAMTGCFPPTSTDARILQAVSWVPLVRITPTEGPPLAPGPDDPDGDGWLCRQAIALGATLVVLSVLRRALRASG